MTHPPFALAAQFQQGGRLRAAINLGNPILASQPSARSMPTGVSVDLANEFARRLGIQIELIRFDSAGKAAQALSEGQVQLAFLARDPERAETIRFSPAYVEIEGSYLGREESALRCNEDVDRSGNRVVVGQGSAYDLYLNRNLKHACVVRAPTSPTVTAEFLRARLEVAAGVRQQLAADAAREGGLRLLPGRFMVIEQAMAIPRRASAAAAIYLAAFVEEMKRSGFVACAMRRHQIHGATVAPPADQLQGEMS
jgi:polar amino acid transport system substrate-binding protein